MKYTNVCMLGVDFQLKAWHSLSFGERKTRLDSPQLPGQQEFVLERSKRLNLDPGRGDWGDKRPVPLDNHLQEASPSG